MTYCQELGGATYAQDQAELDPVFENMWLKGNRERFVKKKVKFFTETLPDELKRLDKTITAFSKVKLNERGLPF